jgi:hypothetical protein
MKIEDIDPNTLIAVGEVAVYEAQLPRAMMLYFDGKKYIAVSMNDAHLFHKGGELPAGIADHNKMVLIISVVEQYFGSSRTWMKKRRIRNYATARMIMFWALRNTTRYTLGQMTSVNGMNYNHSTILHAVKKIDELISVEDALIVPCVRHLCTIFEQQGDGRLAKVYNRLTNQTNK